MALDGAKFICLSDSATEGGIESMRAANAGKIEVTGNSAKAASAAHNVVIEAKGRRFTVGYYMNCDYVVDDPRSEGVHCEIQCDAFGRVTIHNMSVAHPISVNDQIITMKRPLLDGSHIKILDKIFLWKFSKSVEGVASCCNDGKEVMMNDDETSTPQKVIGAAEQAPNSCPDLKPHRNVEKRFTVHNFAYCINSDEEGNTSAELSSITETDSVEPKVTISLEVTTKIEQKKEETTEQTEIDIEKHKMVPAANDTTKTSNERRSVTPEPPADSNAALAIVASTPLVNLNDTPKMDLINCTQNKENKSSEKKQRLISICQQSDVVITSFSPRETGVRIEKSFTAIFKPIAATPKSVYSTPKSMHSDYNNDESSRDFINFTTPATSKKAFTARAIAKNSSMHLIDLTTPSKLAPASSRPRTPIPQKRNQTLPTHVKLDDGIQALAATPSLELPTIIISEISTPQSAESVISVHESRDSSTALIEISTEDSATPSISSSSGRTTAPRTKTPQRLQTSLMKRALLTSAKKNVNATTHRSSPATPVRNVNRVIVASGCSSPLPSTPKSSNRLMAIDSPANVAAAQRRCFSTVKARRSLAAEEINSPSSSMGKSSITTSTPMNPRLAPSRNIAGTAPRLSMIKKRTSPLRGVRKSIGGTTLSSHISKTRRSVVSPRKRSPTSIVAQHVSKARKILCTGNANKSPITSRARSLVAAAVNASSSGSASKTTNSTSSVVEKTKVTVALPNTIVKKYDANKVHDLSRTFIVDDSLEELQVEHPKNITFSPVKPDAAKGENNSSTPSQQELNKTFSPDKVSNDATSFSRIGAVDPFNVATEPISKRFAEVEKLNEERTIKEVKETKIKAEESQEQSFDLFKNVITTELGAEPSKKNKENTNFEVVTQKQTFETLNSDKINNSDAGTEFDNKIQVLVKDATFDDVETISTKPMADSQGTEDFLEEIEYVLNKSDELQQQLGKEVQNIRDKTKEEGKDDKLNFEKLESQNIADTTDNSNFSIVKKVTTECAEKSEFNAQDDQVDCAPSTSTELITGKIIFSVKSNLEKDKTSIDSDLNIFPTSSDNASIDLDTGGRTIHTELSSLSTIQTPSEFNVSSIGIRFVETSVSTDEQQTGADNITESASVSAKKLIIYDKIDEVTSTGSINCTVDAPSEIAVSATEDVHIEKLLSTTRDENHLSKDLESSHDLKTADVDSGNVNEEEKGQPVETGASNIKESLKTSKTTKEAIQTDETKSPVAKLIENTKTEQIVIEISVDESFAEHSEMVMEKFATKTGVVSDSQESSKENIQPEETTPTKTSTITAERKSRSTEAETGKVDEPIKSDDEKENKIVTVAEMVAASSKTSSDPKSTAFEPKTPNLSGIRDMLRTPKYSGVPTTPRLTGLRSLMRTAKASRSGTAELSVTTNDAEEFEGLQALLRTPQVGVKHVEKTPHPAVERVSSDTSTPRRSARRRASANADLTPTSDASNDLLTPLRTTRRRATASSQIIYTPQRITRRRPSLSLESEDEIAEVVTPRKRSGSLYSKRIGAELLLECPLAEDMGAIIEEEANVKENVKEINESQHNVKEIEKKAESIVSKSNVPNFSEVIEESICEEVDNENTQEVELMLSSKDKGSNKKKRTEESVTEAARNKYVSINPSTQRGEIEQKEDAVDPLNVTTCEVSKGQAPQFAENLSVRAVDKTEARILDKSDYEYGKEVAEERKDTNAHGDEQNTPKAVRKSVKIIENALESPKTPVMMGMRKLLTTPKPSIDTPKLIGVRELMRTPKVAITESEIVNLFDDNDDEKFLGLPDLVKTPKVALVRDIKGHERSTFIGMREMLKTPKHISSPQFSGMRELMSTPKACSTPQLAGLEELMQTPKSTKRSDKFNDDKNYDDNEELDKFFKTPRAKNVMIPAEPASALLEPNSNSTLDIMSATTEYDLHSSYQRPLEDIYKTPISTRLTIGDDQEVQSTKKSGTIFINEKKNQSEKNDDRCEVIVPETPATTHTTRLNLSAEEGFDELVDERTTHHKTPPQKVYARNKSHLSINVISDSGLSPFSATDVITDLPKTDVQEWVDNLVVLEGEEEEEREVTVTSSLLNTTEATHDPIAASLCETTTGNATINKNTTEELLADISAVTVSEDPLLPSATKCVETNGAGNDNEKGTVRPTTPIGSEISGINVLDLTNESIFSEPLVVSDSESQHDEGQEISKAEEKRKNLEKSNNRQEIFSAIIENKSQEEEDEDFPLMFVESSESENEDDPRINKSATNDKTMITSPAQNLTASDKTMTENENFSATDEQQQVQESGVIDLDNPNTNEFIQTTICTKKNTDAKQITQSTKFHLEFRNFQPHKTIASQKMRASTPSRCFKPPQIQNNTPSHSRRLSMGVEQQNISVTIDLTEEKSRVLKEREHQTPTLNATECIIEVDESNEETRTTAESVTNLYENAGGVLKENIDITKTAATMTTEEEIHKEFDNFRAHETITIRGKRAATPDVSKTKQTKRQILQGRRLTLGAEKHIPFFTIDLREEKTKLQSKNQLISGGDIQEVDELLNESAVDVSEDATTSSTLKITKLTNEIENDVKIVDMDSNESIEVKGTENVVEQNVDNNVEEEDVEVITEEQSSSHKKSVLETIPNITVENFSTSDGKQIAESDEETQKDYEIPTSKAPTCTTTTAASVILGKVVEEEKSPTDKTEFNASDIFDLTDESPNDPSARNTTEGIIFDLTQEDQSDKKDESKMVHINEESNESSSTDVVFVPDEEKLEYGAMEEEILAGNKNMEFVGIETSFTEESIKNASDERIVAISATEKPTAQTGELEDYLEPLPKAITEGDINEFKPITFLNELAEIDTIASSSKSSRKKEEIKIANGPIKAAEYSYSVNELDRDNEEITVEPIAQVRGQGCAAQESESNDNIKNQDNNVKKEYENISEKLKETTESAATRGRIKLSIEKNSSYEKQVMERVNEESQDTNIVAYDEPTDKAQSITEEIIEITKESVVIETYHEDQEVEIIANQLETPMESDIIIDKSSLIGLESEKETEQATVNETKETEREITTHTEQIPLVAVVIEQEKENISNIEKRNEKTTDEGKESVVPLKEHKDGEISDDDKEKESEIAVIREIKAVYTGSKPIFVNEETETLLNTESEQKTQGSLEAVPKTAFSFKVYGSAISEDTPSTSGQKVLQKIPSITKEETEERSQNVLKLEDALSKSGIEEFVKIVEEPEQVEEMAKVYKSEMLEGKVIIVTKEKVADTKPAEPSKNLISNDPAVQNEIIKEVNKEKFYGGIENQLSIGDEIQATSESITKVKPGEEKPLLDRVEKTAKTNTESRKISAAFKNEDGKERTTTTEVIDNILTDEVVESDAPVPNKRPMLEPSRSIKSAEEKGDVDPLTIALEKEITTNVPASEEGVIKKGTKEEIQGTPATRTARKTSRAKENFQRNKESFCQKATYDKHPILETVKTGPVESTTESEKAVTALKDEGAEKVTIVAEETAKVSTETIEESDEATTSVPTKRKTRDPSVEEIPVTPAKRTLRKASRSKESKEITNKETPILETVRENTIESPESEKVLSELNAENIAEKPTSSEEKEEPIAITQMIEESLESTTSTYNNKANNDKDPLTGVEDKMANEDEIKGTPAKRIVRIPSRSNQNKKEHIICGTTNDNEKSNLETVKECLVESSPSVKTQIVLTGVAVEENPLTTDIEMSKVSVSSVPVNRKTYKPSHSKQTAKEKDEPMTIKETPKNVEVVENETIIDDGKQATPAKRATRKPSRSNKKLQQSEETVSNAKEETTLKPNDSTKFTRPLKDESVEEPEKEDKKADSPELVEETVEASTSETDKRKARKPLRSKQSEEEKSANKNSLTIGDPELGLKQSNIVHTVKDNVPERTLLKASYEVRLSTVVEIIDGSSSESEKSEERKAQSLIEKGAESPITTADKDAKIEPSSFKFTEEKVDSTDVGFEHVEVTNTKPTRRTRKGSQSSQCSVNDEDHLPTTTKRRGRRRGAETPVEHSADEDIETHVDAQPTTKRRRGQTKTKGTVLKLEEIKEVCIDESSFHKLEQPHEDRRNVAIKYEEKVNQQKKLPEIIVTLENKEKEPREIPFEAERETVLIPRSTIDVNKEMSATIRAEESKDLVIQEATTTNYIPPRRGRRKPTVSESSQTSNTAENIEMQATQRNRRRRKPTTQETAVKALQEEAVKSVEAKKEATYESKDNSNAAEGAETSKSTKESKESDLKVVETEMKNEAVEYHATTSSETEEEIKKELLENPKSNKEVSKEQKTVEKEETVKPGRKRVNRQKKGEEPEDHKQQINDENNTHKNDHDNEDIPVPIDTHSKTSKFTKGPANTAVAVESDSVGGRRGRRGAAAAATVLINEVSSAHKRGTPRGKNQHNKILTTIKQEDDAKCSTNAETQRIERKRLPSEIEEKDGASKQQHDTEDDECTSTKIATKPAQKQRGTPRVDETETSHANESHDEGKDTVSIKQRRRRKRKNSMQNVDEVKVAGDGVDEPLKKRVLSRKRRDSSNDSSIHEGTIVNVDNKAGDGHNTSSSSTTPRSRNVPRRAVAAQELNYDESSDAEAQVDLKRRIEKAALPKVIKSSTATADEATTSTLAAEYKTKSLGTPILSTVLTTSRGGRQRKPTARVQQYLEEERAKAETPKRRLLLATAGNETPRRTPGRRARKASATEAAEETEAAVAEDHTSVHITKAATIADTTSEESRSEVEHAHSELEIGAAKGNKRTATSRSSKQTVNSKIPEKSKLSEALDVPATQAVQHPTRGGRAAKAAAAAALIPDEPSGSRSKPRAGRARRGTQIIDDAHNIDTETKDDRSEVSTPSVDVEKGIKKSTTAGRTVRGGRRNKLTEIIADRETGSIGTQQHKTQVIDADDEQEDDDEVVLVSFVDSQEQEEENKPLVKVKGGKATAAAAKKRTATTDKISVVTESQAPKRARRRGAAEVDDDTSQADTSTASTSKSSSHSLKVVRFNAATPLKVKTMTSTVEAPEGVAVEDKAAPATRATRSRRK